MLPCRFHARHGSRPCQAVKHVVNQNHSRTLRRCLAAASKPEARWPRKVFSGIQPTGIPHLGNYLGALKQWREMQDGSPESDTLLFSIVDLHALTVKQDPTQFRAWRRQTLAMLLALGLDPERCIIFYQSGVPAHSQLMWLLSCQASTGYLGRMTQWKDKSASESENSEKLKLGLFSYPVLMAADILVHHASHVPVGDDQLQHLEFARDLARGFNAKVGRDCLPLPQALISPARRIMSLSDPSKKMSKSDANPKSRILLTDSERQIRAKIASALTDSDNMVSYDPANRPGVSNLLDILFHSGAEPGFSDQQQLADDMKGLDMRAFKARVADGVEKIVRPIREQYAAIIDDTVRIEEVEKNGTNRARAHASLTMDRIWPLLGLR